MKPRIGSLFSGAGGPDLAVEQVFGGETAWHSEVDPAASRVLAHRWPGVPNLGDITRIDWDTAEPVDILCGGWPCQPWSNAGKRKGTADERALWPHVAAAVRALRPRFVVLENVSAIIVLGELARAVGDLSAAGYDTQWVCLRAGDAGAPHQRDRCFILASDTAGPSTRTCLRQGRLPLEHRGSRRDDAACSAGVRHSILDYGVFNDRIRKWELVTASVAPCAAEFTPDNRAMVAPAFTEWMLGWPAGWVTAVPGLTQEDMLRCAGNGVCPQQAIAALRWLLAVCSHENPGACSEQARDATD